MKLKQIASLILILSFNFVLCQKSIFIDEKGDTLSKSQIKAKQKKLGKSLCNWSFIGNDGKEYTKLSKNLYLKGNLNYQTIKSELEKITKSKFNDSITIIIEFYFKDDFCEERRKDNIWSRDEINKRKQFQKPQKKIINSKGVYFVCLFEKGIKLRNKKTKENEYFFSDENNFFRENIFTEPATCGSFAAVKSNGETLIRNGEYRADWFFNHLTNENWSLFFPKENKEPN